jgi:hypothetical protein
MTVLQPRGPFVFGSEQNGLEKRLVVQQIYRFAPYYAATSHSRASGCVLKTGRSRREKVLKFS